MNCEEYDASLCRRVKEIESALNELGDQKHQALLLLTGKECDVCGGKKVCLLVLVALVL